MIKFIIGLIAVVFIALVAYMFTQSENKETKKIETKVTKSHEVEKPKVSKLKEKEHLSAKVEKKDVTDKVVASQRDTEVSNSAEPSDEIGKGLTLEGIENVDVSDEEKERMRDDLVYYQNQNTELSKALSDEEILEIIKEDLKKDSNN